MYVKGVAYSHEPTDNCLLLVAYCFGLLVQYLAALVQSHMSSMSTVLSFLVASVLNKKALKTDSTLPVQQQTTDRQSQ